MRKVRKAKRPVLTIHNIELREIVVETELTNGKSLLESMDLVLHDPQHNVQNGRKKANYE